MLQTLHRALCYQKHRLRFLMIIQPAKSVPFPLAYSQGGKTQEMQKSKVTTISFPVSFSENTLSLNVSIIEPYSADKVLIPQLDSISKSNFKMHLHDPRGDQSGSFSTYYISCGL